MHACDAWGGAPGLEFGYYRASQRSITLDASRPEAEPLLRSLAQSVDVVVVSPTTKRPSPGSISMIHGRAGCRRTASSQP